MNIALGFGITEKNVEANVLKRIKNGEDIESIRKEYKEIAEKYDKMNREEAPERYSYFYNYGGSLKFHHINRQHPFSPDGWGLLQTEVDLPMIVNQPQ